MNNQLLMLLTQLMQANQTQQNPLAQLLNAQNQQPDLLSLLSGGNNQNPLNTLLSGTQQPQLDVNQLALLVQQLQSAQQPQQPQIDPNMLQALQALVGKQDGQQGDQSQDLLSLLKGKSDTTESDDMREAIKFNLEFEKFIEDYEDHFPNWFDPKEAIGQVDKWAKTDNEKAQALAAATVKAFFKDEGAMELLEERDRNFVKENVLKEGLKESQIDRKLAWPMMQRAIHNKTTLGDNQPRGDKGSESVIEDFGSRFEHGQKAASGDE